MTQADSRKRPGYSSSGDSVEGHLSKRTFQGNIDVVPTMSEAAITCLSDLARYVEESMVKTEVLKNPFGILDNAKEGMSVIGIAFSVLTLLIHCDNGAFANTKYREDGKIHGQEITFCGVCAHHQNGIVE